MVWYGADREDERAEWRASTTSNADRSQIDFFTYIHIHTQEDSSCCFTELRGEKETAKPSISFSLIDVLRFIKYASGASAIRTFGDHMSSISLFADRNLWSWWKM